MPFLSKPTTTRPPATTTGRRMRPESLDIQETAWRRDGGLSSMACSRKSLRAGIEKIFVIAPADQFFQFHCA